MRAQPLFVLLMTSLAITARAQVHLPAKDTVMKGATIEVLQAYKPQVKQAPKPEWVPQLPPPDTSHSVANYDDVPQQSLYYTYTSMPLHPLALGREMQQLPFANYVKLGGGNLNTIYLDAGIGGIYGKDYETAFHLHHLSQKGSIPNQQSSLSGLEAEGMYHGSETDWHAALNVERNQYYNYGYLPYVAVPPTDSVKQTYTTVRVEVDMQNKADSNAVFSYHPSVSGSAFLARYNTSETNLGFDLPFYFKIEKALQAQVGVSGSIVNLKTDTISGSNNYVALNAGFSYHNGQFRGHALLGGAVGKDSKKYLLPDIYAAYLLPGTSCSLFAGLQSTLRQNTYEQLSSENPFMVNTYLTKQTSRTEYFAGVQGSYQDHFSYSARAGFWNYQYLPAFVNDFGDQRMFRVGYYQNDVTALSLRLAARYTLADKWSVGITGDFFRYNTGTENYVLGEPSARIRGDFRIMPSKKFVVSAYLSMMSGIYGVNSFHVVDKLNSFVDIGGNAEYLIIPRLGVFMALDNILNDKYQRWPGYQAYGINIYGGLRLKF